MQFNGAFDRCMAQPGQRDDLLDLDLLEMQLHDLLARLVQPLRCLIPCDFFFSSRVKLQI